MLTQADARAWTAASIDASVSWYHALPEAVWDVFQQIKPSEPVTVVELPASARACCRSALAAVHAALETGRGFAILEGPAERLPLRAAQLLYWVVGQGLGRPFAQNVQGTLLYDVRDMGQDLTQGARFSVTNYASSFHTDNSFGVDILDYVGLLCLQTAKTGGRSQLLSGYALHHELRTRHPDVLAILEQPFHVDRRGGTRTGEEPTVQYPIVAHHDGGLLFRYLRFWIEAGHQKIGLPLTAAQVRALNVLDAVMRERGLYLEFNLKPGQMYFINNRWLLHNRTAFEDYPEPERRRHLVRLWLQG